MPDSLTREDLRQIRKVYPQAPYVIHPYAYSYFLGDLHGPVAQQAAMHRKLTYGSTAPVLRLRKYERVSKSYPYSFYEDPNIPLDIPKDDGWPYSSYYYLMDYDEKGPAAYVPGKTSVPGTMAIPPGNITNKRIPNINRPAKVPRAQATASYLSMEGF